MSSPSIEKEKEEKRCVFLKNYENDMNMGLSYALGPFPDEPLLSAIDKTLLLSNRFRNHFNFDEQIAYKKTLSSSHGTECDIENSKFLRECAQSCPDLTSPNESIKETFQEQITYPSKSSSENELVKKHEEKDNDDTPANRMWTVMNTTDDGIRTYEIWSEKTSESAPSRVFILPPQGGVYSFEYVNGE